MARKKGPVLYELLRKDHAEKRLPEPKQEIVSPETPADASPAAVTAADPAGPPAPRKDAPEEDRETLVFHLTRMQAALAAGATIAAILVIALIAGRSGRPAATEQPGAADKAAAETEPQQPLALLLPEPGSEPKPDVPVKVVPQAESEIAPAGPADDAEPSGETLRPSGQAAGPVALAKGDSRKAGLNYLVIQIIPERPDMQEHVAAVRKFLASRGIKTIEVAGDNGGTWVMSEEGFNWEDASDRRRLDDLTETVKKVGKEYATAKYAGRYDFRAPFVKKYKGK